MLRGCGVCYSSVATRGNRRYIGSGLKDERFPKILGDMVTEAQMKRISAALAPILN